MGITGLLPLIKSIHEPTHLEHFAGKTIAVDGNVWLHRGAFACALDLALKQDTKKYIEYFLRQIQLLKVNGVTPYIVFDGNPLPIKSVTVDERRRRRETALSKGKELLALGRRQEAMEYFQKAIEITPRMVQQIVKVLKDKRILHVIAPYEADAQLTYLINTNKVDAVLTEDSDLLVFGCHTVFFKMNASGHGVMIRRQNLENATEIDMRGWNMTKIRHMCILSGCDYLPSLPGIGLKNAHKLLKNYRTIDGVFRYFRASGKMKDVPDYEEKFQCANDAFLYQFVCDPDTGRYIPLHSPPAGVDPENMKFLGSSGITNNRSTCTELNMSLDSQQSNDTSNSSLDSSSIKTVSSTTSNKDIRKYFDQSNKENIPPWAVLPDNKPIRETNNITARDIFKVFNTKAAAATTTSSSHNSQLSLASKRSSPFLKTNNRISLGDKSNNSERSDRMSLGDKSNNLERNNRMSLGDKSNHSSATKSSSLQKRKKGTMSALGSIDMNRIPDDDSIPPPSSKRRSSPPPSSSPSLTAKTTSSRNTSEQQRPIITASSFLFSS
ncbi:related to exo1-exonuclease which interacts withmsh2p [Lichtheimia corymbifera JMRC:FSU:9682]|uniref:Related to exo1-exonuclease which interacts withmsh2p n=1 Tax=Lichtheimia corymbifera JMRC:FSU:9682 TaxID=1263082 RepID=A0A068RTX8_9FUNG|nr:related to exo1-exonuclease which interacts withmsh2p [Lichtheimia corymbifera JMRC:FSU:9682]